MSGDEPENTEHEFTEPVRDLLGRALGPEEPNVDKMASNAEERGRVLRRRRTTMQVVGAVAAVGVVAGGAVAVAGALGGSKGSAAPGGGGTHSSAPAPATSTGTPGILPSSGTAPGSPVPPTTPSFSNSYGQGWTGAWATHTPYADLLASLIPAGMSKSTANINPLGTADGRVVVDDGHGKALIKVAPSKGEGTPQSLDPKCGGYMDLIECHYAKLPDGTEVVTAISGGASDSQAPGVDFWHGEVLFKDGNYMHLSLRNTDVDGNPPTRKDSPLSLDQLKAIVTDSKWDALITQFPRNT